MLQTTLILLQRFARETTILLPESCMLTLHAVCRIYSNEGRAIKSPSSSHSVTKCPLCVRILRLKVPCGIGNRGQARSLIVRRRGAWHKETLSGYFNFNLSIKQRCFRPVQKSDRRLASFAWRQKLMLPEASSDNKEPLLWRCATLWDKNVLSVKGNSMQL